MNAIFRPEIETDDRVLRHMRLCQDLAELGMKLARATAEKALAALTKPAETTEAPAAYAAKTVSKTPDYAQLFIRLSNLVRQVIGLETRLANGEAPRAASSPARPYADLRRDLIRQALDFAIGDNPERAAMRRAARDTLDQKLAADPQGHIRPAAMIHAILDPLGISVSFSKMPTALRHALTGKKPA